MKNGWCMKLKLALLDEVMSKDEALLCLLRVLASRSVRLTLWPPETANKDALTYCLFLHGAFAVWDWIHNPPQVTGRQQSLVWLTVQTKGSWGWGSINPCSGYHLARSLLCYVSLSGFWRKLFALGNISHYAVIPCLMLGGIKQTSDEGLLTFTVLKIPIKDLHQPPPISLNINIFWLDYHLLRNDVTLQN